MRGFFGLIITVLLLAPAESHACSIPVFRYALERWQPTPYEVLIYHRGPLADADRKAVAEFERVSRSANIEITQVDLDRKGDADFKAIWEKFGGKNPLPWVIIRFPESEAKTPPAWSGPLDLSQLKSLVDSPARQQVVRKLFSGDSAVFILLESGDEKADSDAAKLLDDELPKLEKRIVLPAPTREGPQLRSDLPLKVSLPYSRLSRAKAEEQGFVQLLMACENGLDKTKGPIVFAVFGRGRVLTALHGRDLKAAEVESVSRFLCGACSCQVKELNPGVDMLFNARWEAFLEIEMAPNPREIKIPEKR